MFKRFAFILAMLTTVNIASAQGLKLALRWAFLEVEATI